MSKIDGYSPSEWVKDESLVLVVNRQIGDRTVQTRHISSVQRADDGQMWPSWPFMADNATAEIVTREVNNG